MNSSNEKLRLATKNNLMNSSNEKFRAKIVTEPTLILEFEQKLNLYLDFLAMVNVSNWIMVPFKKKDQFQAYKTIITKANNGQIVKNCLKTRWWWQVADSNEKINLLWTSWKKSKFIKSMKSIQSKRFERQDGVEGIQASKLKLLTKIMEEGQIRLINEKINKNAPYIYNESKRIMRR